MLGGLATLSLACLPLHYMVSAVYKARCLILMWSVISLVALSFPIMSYISRLLKAKLQYKGNIAGDVGGEGVFEVETNKL